MCHRRLSILLSLAALILTGCEKDDNPPRVITQTPTPDTITAERQGVVNSPLVKLQFNEALLDSSVPDSTMALEYNGDVLPGLFAFSSTLNTIAFEPIQPLFFLREYNVRIKSGISDLEGNRTKTGTDWSFRVKDGTFSSSRLAEGFTGNATQPQIAFGSNGRGHIIWTQAGSEGRTNIRARAIEGTNFNSLDSVLKRAIDIEDKNDDPETPDAGDANSPQIAVDVAGNAIAVWSQSIGGVLRILTNRFTHADPDDIEPDDITVGTWGHTLNLLSLSDPVSDATLPQIAFAPNGNAIAVWQQSNGIYANFYAKTTKTWSGPERIDDGTGIASAPQIAFDSLNNGIAVWAQDNQVFANRYSGSWTGPDDVGNNSGATAAPQIAVDPDGTTALIVWAQSDGTRDNIWSARFNGSAWEGPTPLETRSGNAQTPQIVVNAEGNGFAIWAQASSSTSTRYRIYVSRFDGQSWTPEPDPIDVFSSDVYVPEIAERGSSTQPQIAIDGDGNAIAVWSVDGDGSKIPAFVAANRYRGSRAREDLRGWINAGIIDAVSTPYTKDGNNPQIAITPEFTAMAVWQKKDEDDVTNMLLSAFR